MSDHTPEPDRLPLGDGPLASDELVVRARTDRTALGALYDRSYPAVARYCLRRLFDRTTAEDAVSEVFLQVARHIRDFGGRTETEFRRWLFRIATNEVNAQLRVATRRKVIFDAAAAAGELGSGCVEATPTDLELADWPTLYQAILELDEREQAIVSLRFFADCSHEEIAAVVGGTAGAVRTALSRTLARLREKFNPVRTEEKH